LAAIVFGLLFVGWCSSQFNSPAPSGRQGTKPTTTSSRPEPEVLANVRFTGTQFIVQNLGAKPWTEVQFAINSGVLNSGFTAEVTRLDAKSEYAIGALQFANGDGQRFNPIQFKPQTFRVRAKIDGQFAYWNGSFK